MPRKPAAAPTVSASHGSVAMGFVRGLLAGLRARGADPAPLLRAAGIAPALLDDPAARTSLAAYAALYNLTVAALQDEGFALFPHSLAPGMFEFLCRSVVSARSLEEALARAAGYLRVVLPELELRLVREHPLARLEIVERATLGEGGADPRRVFALEWTLRLIHALACWLVGRSLPLASVEFPFAPPAHADDYALIYTANSIFHAERLVARFHANLLDLPVRRDDAALTRFLEGAPGRIAMLYRRDRGSVRQVRDLLAQALPTALSIEDVAGALHQSPRTLHRRLHEEGASFRAIKDALRRDLALARLERPEDPIGRIAADLGYAELSAFFRAFRSWTGMAPSTYRKRFRETAARA